MRKNGKIALAIKSIYDISIWAGLSAKSQSIVINPTLSATEFVLK